MKNPIKLARLALTNYLEERRRSQELDRELEAALIDPTFLDRATRPPQKVEVSFLDEPVAVEVRHILRSLNVKSIDGILRV